MAQAVSDQAMTNPYASPAAETSGSKLIAYVQLFRLANVFTALADVLMGYLFTHPEPQAAIESRWLACRCCWLPRCSIRPAWC